MTPLEKLKKIKQRLNNHNPIIQRIEAQVRNTKAATALMDNIVNAENPQRRYTGNTGKRNSYLDYYQNDTAEVGVGVTNTPNVKRGRERNIAFMDLEAGGSYEQRSSKSSPSDMRLRSAVVKDAIARGIGEVKSGDRITAEPTSSSRARLYERWGGKAFAADKKTGKIDTRVTRDGGTINIRGEKTAAPNFKGMKADLAKMAIKHVMRTVGGPFLQGAMTVDSVAKQATGTSISENKQQQLDRTHEALKKWGML